MPLLDRSLATYYDCFHMTPAGSRAVAAAIARAVLGEPLAGESEPRCVDLRAS
jgi:hypothetical protein